MPIQHINSLNQRQFAEKITGAKIIGVGTTVTLDANKLPILCSINIMLSNGCSVMIGADEPEEGEETPVDVWLLKPQEKSNG